MVMCVIFCMMGFYFITPSLSASIDNCVLKLYVNENYQGKIYQLVDGGQWTVGDTPKLFDIDARYAELLGVQKQCTAHFYTDVGCTVSSGLILTADNGISRSYMRGPNNNKPPVKCIRMVVSDATAPSGPNCGLILYENPDMTGKQTLLSGINPDNKFSGIMINGKGAFSGDSGSTWVVPRSFVLIDPPNYPVVHCQVCLYSDTHCTSGNSIHLPDLSGLDGRSGVGVASYPGDALCIHLYETELIGQQAILTAPKYLWDSFPNITIAIVIGILLNLFAVSYCTFYVCCGTRRKLTKYFDIPAYSYDTQSQNNASSV